MALPDGFDLDALLAPIAGDSPAGEDVRADYSAQSPYNRLRDARSNARDAEKQAESFDPGGQPAVDPAPFWRTLREIGLKLLQENTKDLEIAAWVTEGFVRSHGLGGLAGGSQLIAGLAERYWDVVFPLPDEYGIETRVAAVTGLNGRNGNGSLIAPLFKLILFNRPDGSPIALYQYQASAKLATLDARARQQRIENGVIPFEQIELEARTTGRASMIQLRADAAAALAGWQAMTAVLDEKAGAEAPSTSHVRDVIQEIVDIAARFAPEEPTAASAEQPVAQTGEADAAAGLADLTPGTMAAAPGRIVSREDALRSLESIAAYFRRTEPHSPLSYTLDEAVRRARLPWMELLNEVISDRGSRDAILTTLGIRPPPPE